MSKHYWEIEKYSRFSPLDKKWESVSDCVKAIVEEQNSSAIINVSLKETVLVII